MKPVKPIPFYGNRETREFEVNQSLQKTVSELEKRIANLETVVYHVVEIIKDIRYEMNKNKE